MKKLEVEIAMCWSNYPQVLASWRNLKCVYFEADTVGTDYLCNKEHRHTQANRKLYSSLTTRKQ